jgi:glucose-6-phosphate isomerase
MLVRHARDEIKSLRLQELCLDNHRVSSLVTVHSSNDNSLIVDLSRQHLTLETIHHLLHLANARGCIDFLKDLPYGFNNRYLALRAPRGSCMLNKLEQDGDPNKNICFSIHTEWDRIHRVSESIRKGQLRGVTGTVLRDVLVVGSGVAMEALKFIYYALLQDPVGQQSSCMPATSTRRTFTSTGTPIVENRRLRLVSSIDAMEVQQAIQDLDPASTLVISLALTGQEETGLASRLLKHWLLKELGNASRKMDLIFNKHMLLVTGNERLYHASKPESVFYVDNIAEPVSTLSAMAVLPLSIIFGWTLIQDQLLAGAHAMDAHLLETNPRHNIPLLLALVDVWNDACLQQEGRIVQPFGQAFEQYGNYVAAVESQICGSPSQPAYASYASSSCGPVLVGRQQYDKLLHQSSRVLPVELVMTMDPPSMSTFSREDVLAHHDTLLCSLLGQADELASHNRPSTLLLVGKLDAFMCGQWISLTEHRAILKAKLWNMPTDLPRETGASLRMSKTDRLRMDILGKRLLDQKAPLDDSTITMIDEAEEDISLSTATLLTNYASRTRELRRASKIV